MEKKDIKIGQKYTIISGGKVAKKFEGALCQVKDIFKTKACVQIISYRKLYGMMVKSIPFIQLKFYSDFVFKSQKITLSSGSDYVCRRFGFEKGKTYDTVECPPDQKVNYEKDLWIQSKDHGPVRLLQSEYY